MLGRDHALSGALMGLAAVTVAPLLGASIDLRGAVVLVVVTAGAALWPDIDHPSATVAHAFGPVSDLVARLANRAGERVHAATRSRYDRPCRDGHRTITHTLAFALASGALVFGVGEFWPLWGTLGVLFVMISLALRGMAGRWAYRAGWLYLSMVAAALAGWTYYAASGGISPILLGVAVALGSFTHCLGDSCTLAGCPWLWPMPIAGRRWYPIGTPQWLRFRTGGDGYGGEERLRLAMGVALVALALVQVPDFYPWLGGRIGALWA